MFDDDDQFAMLNSPQEKFLAMLEAEAQDERRQQLEAEGVQPWRVASSCPAAESAPPPLPSAQPARMPTVIEDVLEMLPTGVARDHVSGQFGVERRTISMKEAAELLREKRAPTIKTWPMLDEMPMLEMRFSDSNEQPVQAVLDRWRKAMDRMADDAFLFGIPRKMMDFGGGDDTQDAQKAMDGQRARAKREFHAYTYGSFPPADPDSSSPAFVRASIDDEVADTLLAINNRPRGKNAASPRQVMVLKGRDMAEADRAGARFRFDPRAYLAPEKEGGDA